MSFEDTLHRMAETCDECIEILNNMISTTDKMIEICDKHSYKFGEIYKLHQMLLKKNIPHHYAEHKIGGYHLIYHGKKERNPSKPGCICGPFMNAVCIVTYDADSNKVKIKGLLTEEEYLVNEVKGNLTAQEVFERIQKHWETEN